MTVLALTDSETAWAVTLAVGLVIALVVWGLLEALRRTVNQVERSVDDLWSMGQRVAQNTQAAHQLGTTKARGVDLHEELRQHVPERSGG